jgi:hypothetical protein
MTIEQILAYNAEINKQIDIERRRPTTPGMHPRSFKLQQDEKISELQKLLK